MRVRLKLADEYHVSSPTHTAGRIAAKVWARSRSSLANRILRPSSAFSTQLLRGDATVGLRQSDVDIVHLHWICDGFLGIGDISRLASPIVWTLHDQWPFTGGCHYSGDCDGYAEACGRCPILSEKHDTGVSRFVHQTKQRSWKNLKFSIVSPSKWLADCADRSGLFHGRAIRVIPYPIDLQTFKPIPKDQARAILNLEQTKPTLLYAAMAATTDLRKGYDLLELTLRVLRPNIEDLQLVVIGASETGTPLADDRHVRCLGNLHDDITLALAYSAADVFVAPSRQDNLPNTVIESLACGTPVAAFRVGGLPDMVNHEQTGFLAKPFDHRHLAAGISYLLNRDRYQQVSAAARRSAETLFSPQTVAAEYQELYSSLISAGEDFEFQSSTDEHTC